MGAGLAEVAVVFVATVFGLPLCFFALMAALDRLERSLSTPAGPDPAPAGVQLAPAQAPASPEAAVVTLPVGAAAPTAAAV